MSFWLTEKYELKKKCYQCFMFVYPAKCRTCLFFEIDKLIFFLNQNSLNICYQFNFYGWCRKSESKSNFLLLILVSFLFQRVKTTAVSFRWWQLTSAWSRSLQILAFLNFFSCEFILFLEISNFSLQIF